MMQEDQAEQKATPVVLCRFDDLAEGQATAVDGRGEGIEECLIVLRQDGRARAYVNVCPHMGRRLDWAPGRFLFKDGILTCAVHGASFKAATGLCVGGPCRGESLVEVRVRVDAQGRVVLDGAHG